jgi:hypothetical protein
LGGDVGRDSATPTPARKIPATASAAATGTAIRNLDLETVSNDSLAGSIESLRESIRWLPSAVTPPNFQFFDDAFGILRLGRAPRPDATSAERGPVRWHRSCFCYTAMRLRLTNLFGVLLLGAGCGGQVGQPPPPPPEPPAPLTFQLQNGGTSSLYIYVSCLADVTFTNLDDPSTSIRLPNGGCGICDCAAQTCPSVVCGPCFMGGLEVAPGGNDQYFWTPVDITYRTGATSTCSSSRTLPAGHYRIDVPVYTTSADANAKTGARVVSQSFQLPATDVITVPLATP